MKSGTSMRNRFNYRSNGPGFSPRPTDLPADTRWTRATVGADHAVQLDRSVATSSVLARREEASGTARSYFKPAQPKSHFTHTAGIPVLISIFFCVCFFAFHILKVGDSIDSWQRFLQLHSLVITWVDEKKCFLTEPLHLTSLVQARQKSQDYNVRINFYY